MGKAHAGGEAEQQAWEYTWTSGLMEGTQPKSLSGKHKTMIDANNHILTNDKCKLDFHVAWQATQHGHGASYHVDGRETDIYNNQS